MKKSFLFCASPCLVTLCMLTLFSVASFLGGCTSAKAPVPDELPGRPLFNGETFDSWESIAFGGEATPYIDSSCMVIPMATAGSLSGLRYMGADSLPHNDYELYFEAKRVAGHDFFAGATFPVHNSHLTLIMGGWGGSVCGLSNIDNLDAAQNETRFIKSFTDNVWYAVRLRVSEGRVQAWFNQEQVVDFLTTGRKLNLRQEVGLTAPLGFCTFLTTGAIRNVRLLEL